MKSRRSCKIKGLRLFTCQKGAAGEQKIFRKSNTGDFTDGIEVHLAPLFGDMEVDIPGDLAVVMTEAARDDLERNAGLDKERRHAQPYP